MDNNDYATEFVEDDGNKWRVTNTDRGVVGWVVMEGDRFRSRVHLGEKWVTIWFGNGLKTAIEQVIWYDRAMNLEAA